MRFCQGTVAFLLAAAATTITASITPQKSLSSPFLPHSNTQNPKGIFGIQKHQAHSIATSTVPRGGAVAEEVTDEDESETEDVPVKLYLPGLLNASVLKKTVSTMIISVEYCVQRIFS
jgi:hypothetical protein